MRESEVKPLDCSDDELILSHSKPVDFGKKTWEQYVIEKPHKTVKITEEEVPLDNYDDELDLRLPADESIERCFQEEPSDNFEYSKEIIYDNSTVPMEHVFENVQFPRKFSDEIDEYVIGDRTGNQRLGSLIYKTWFESNCGG